MYSYSEADFEELENEIEFCLQNIAHPRCTLAEAGRFYEEAAEILRAHGLLRLLVDADGDGFRTDLVMSGHARRAYLRRCRSARHDDYFLATSRSGSVLDALAGDDEALAKEIVRLSPPDWRPGDEYEDDFCHHRFIGACLVGAPADEREAILARFDRAAGGQDARLSLCRALHRRDSAGFEAAFEGLLAERREEVASDTRIEDEAAAAIGSVVFVEGIALVKLARRAGLETAPEYPMCPALALLSQPAPNPQDEFAYP